MGITVPAVSWFLIRGRQRILREYPSLDRKEAVKGRNACLMRGKKPKERERYVLYTNGLLVEVTKEVYLEWYQSRRREKYQIEKQKKHGVCSLEAIGQLAQERLNIWDNSPEEACIEKEKKEWLRQGIQALSEERLLIFLLFYEEKTVNETAAQLGYGRKTITNRKKSSAAET